MSTNNHQLIPQRGRRHLATLVCALCASATLPCLLAADMSLKPVAQTSVADDLWIALTCLSPTGVGSLDSTLNWTILTTRTNPVPLRVPPAEYFCQVEMFDAKSNAMPRTEVGKKVGARFLDFDLSMLRTAPQMQLIRACRSEDQLLQLLLFRPSDIFTLDRPGTYVLRLRFQVVAFFGLPGSRTPRLVRFPPLDYRIVMREKEGPRAPRRINRKGVKP